MEANEFMLVDRITKIRSMNELHDLEGKAYISYSGGKDSTVLSHLIDEALPGNNIPRVYLNTGIEYKKVVAFVERERRPYNDNQSTEQYQNHIRRTRLSVQKQRA